MIRIIVKEGENIEKALRRFRKRCNETKLIKQLRDRREYLKPSIRRRIQKLATIYKNKRR